MNNDRKNRLYDVADIFDDAISELEDIIDEEQDAFDSMPEGLQESSRGDKSLEYIDLMEGAISMAADVQSYIIDKIIKKK